MLTPRGLRPTSLCTFLYGVVEFSKEGMVDFVTLLNAKSGFSVNTAMIVLHRKTPLLLYLLQKSHKAYS